MVTYACTCVWGDVGRNIHDDDAMVSHIREGYTVCSRMYRM